MTISIEEKIKKLRNDIYWETNKQKEFEKRRELSVLENLISIINDRKDENSIIIVTGDIFHSKTEMSPESVSLGTLFLNKLS